MSILSSVSLFRLEFAGLEKFFLIIIIFMLPYMYM